MTKIAEKTQLQQCPAQHARAVDTPAHLHGAGLASVEALESCNALGLTQGWQLFVPGLVPANCEENLRRRPQIMPAQCKRVICMVCRSLHEGQALHSATTSAGLSLCELCVWSCQEAFLMSSSARLVCIFFQL
ncbi:unnamed protein product [Symbiodinium natans]|uniref:Uncharacterized protein n=1 Tax=Symbiodinium natans TaxID=878477 RepID=A0A812QZB8_9DINO|nr:unnamed protein product [Symbiodinium natans]